MYKSYFFPLNKLQDLMPFLWHNKEYQEKFLRILINQNYLCGIIDCEKEIEISRTDGGFLIEQVSD